MTTRHWPRSRWITPAVALGLGFVFLGAQWSAGDPRSGLVSLLIMAATAAIFAFGGRSETIRGLTTGRDERFAQIDLKATAVTGLVLIITVIVAWLVEIARGHSGNPYGWLGAIAGLTYIGAVAFFRWRS